MAAAIIGAARGQTQIDLRTKRNNIDFSLAAKTRPSKTVTLVPAVCTVGERCYSSSAGTVNCSAQPRLLLNPAGNDRYRSKYNLVAPSRHDRSAPEADLVEAPRKV